MSRAINKTTGLTEKQDSFCRAFIETGNASEAYRRAYDAENMKPTSINRSAKSLMDNPKIAARIEQLRAPIIERHNQTVNDLLIELETARIAALSFEQASAAVSATMAKAKLLGYDQKQAPVEDNPLLALLSQIQGLAPLRIVSGEVIDNE